MTEFAFTLGPLERGFLAGFLEGEATLAITELNAGQSLSCAALVRLRDDEQELLEWIVAVTGLGRLYRVPAQVRSRPQIAWTVQSRDDCEELERLVAPCGFGGRRAAELVLWQEALRVWRHGDGDRRRRRLRELKQELRETRRFGGGAATAALPADERLFRGYISGLVCAEGHFGIHGRRPQFAMHLRQDDRPLLEALAARTGLGRIYEHRSPPPLNPSTVWIVGARAEMAELAALMRSGQLRGRKRDEMEEWAVAVEELCRAGAAGTRPDHQVLDSARNRLADARSYRPPPRTALLRVAGRDLRAEAIAALRRWGDEVDGRLTATAYVQWRARVGGVPARNTIARAFGSWHAALSAAGLGDRAHPLRRRGGEAGRAARRKAQQQRVIEAVLRCAQELGRMPRAMEFFRWRLETAPDTPTQGTVYTLFPGGWKAVLAAASPGA